MITGGLFEAIKDTMMIIIGHLKFAFDVRITDSNTECTEIPEYPLDAIREALLNCMIHRDYQNPC